MGVRCWGVDGIVVGVRIDSLGVVRNGWLGLGLTLADNPTSFHISTNLILTWEVCFRRRPAFSGVMG